MKKIVFLVVTCMLSNVAFADCNFLTEINKLPDGNYEYSRGCHIHVGELVQDNQTKDQQIVDFKKAIELKDLAITTSDQRAQLWMDTSIKLEGHIQVMDSLKKTNEWMAFGLGALTVIATGFALSAVTNRH